MSCEDHPQFADIFINVIKLWPDETHDKVVLKKNTRNESITP